MFAAGAISAKLMLTSSAARRMDSRVSTVFIFFIDY